MVDSQEIIERSVYDAILNVLVKLDLSLDPNKYLPATLETKKKFDEDKSKLRRYIDLYGTGNNQAKGRDIAPRIVINARGFYPGAIGMPKELLESAADGGFHLHEYPYEALDQMIDIHLVANNQKDLRILHQVLFWSIPQRGYIKPYTEDSFLPSGNIFIELQNFFDYPNNEQGLMDKVYQFSVRDCIVGDREDISDISPITDITVVLEKFDKSLEELLKVNNEKL